MKKLLIPVLLFTAVSSYAASADIGLKFEIDPLPRMEAGQFFSTFFHVYNNGPDTAEKIVIRVDAPGAKSLYVEKASIVSMPAGNSESVYVEVHGNGVRETIPLTVSVSADTPDPNAADNTLTRNIEFVRLPDLVVLLQQLTPAGDPEEPTSIGVRADNEGIAAADDVTLDVAFPAGTTNISVRTATNCSVSGTNVHCSFGTLGPNAFSPPVTIHVTTPPLYDGGNPTFTAQVSSPTPDFNVHNNTVTGSWQILPFYVVSNTNDSGPGSLRQAIIDTGARCITDACRIGFRIPLDAGAGATIAPLSPLPPVTGIVFIDGTTEKTFTGRSDARPIVTIDGSKAGGGNGIEILTDGPSVDDLAITGFTHGAGVFLMQTQRGIRTHVVSKTELVGNMRGVIAFGAVFVDINHNVIKNNLRSGIWLETTLDSPNVGSNTIDGNGASGIYVAAPTDWARIGGNTITNNREFGIAVHPKVVRLSAASNVIAGNGNFGIDIGLDLATPNVPLDINRAPNTPVLQSATYDPATDTTFVEGELQSTGDRFHVFFFANSRVDANGYAQAEQVLYTPEDSPFPTGHFRVAVKGDFRGKYIDALTVRYHLELENTLEEYLTFEQTSELSKAVPVK